LKVPTLSLTMGQDAKSAPRVAGAKCSEAKRAPEARAWADINLRFDEHGSPAAFIALRLGTGSVSLRERAGVSPCLG
jgi:hypothetical protein